MWFVGNRQTTRAIFCNNLNASMNFIMSKCVELLSVSNVVDSFFSSYCKGQWGLIVGELMRRCYAIGKI